MFRLIRFSFKTIVRLKLLGLAFSAGMAAAYAIQLRAQQRSWGLFPAAAEHALVGDELVSDADVVETRSIEIEAAPEKVWPWLAQLGYGRGGWYGFRALDRPWSPAGGSLARSADTILEEHQHLAEGDVVPIHKGGGFVVREIDPGRSMALYLDDAISREQLEELAAELPDEAAQAAADSDMPPFAVSWAFQLEDAPGERTRLVEQIRVRIDVRSDVQRRFMPLLGLGVFALVRSQLLGIKSRAEGTLDAAD